jgi:hypothetical protein
LLWVAGLATAVPVFLWIAAPRFSDPSFGPPQPWWATLLPVAIGTSGVIFGLAWMWRIFKAPTKYGDSARWRYRDR